MIPALPLQWLHWVLLLEASAWAPLHSQMAPCPLHNCWLKTRSQLCPYKIVRKLERWTVCAHRAHNCKWHRNEIKRRHQSCWHHNSYGDSSTLIAWTFQRYPTYVSMATAFKLDRNHWSTFKQKKVRPYPLLFKPSSFSKLVDNAVTTRPTGYRTIDNHATGRTCHIPFLILMHVSWVSHIMANRTILFDMKTSNTNPMTTTIGI